MKSITISFVYGSKVDNLANQGQDTRAIQSYMGHADIKNTVIYTESARSPVQEPPKLSNLS